MKEQKGTIMKEQKKINHQKGFINFIKSQKRAFIDNNIEVLMESSTDNIRINNDICNLIGIDELNNLIIVTNKKKVYQLYLDEIKSFIVFAVRPELMNDNRELLLNRLG